MALKDWKKFLTGWKKMDGSMKGIRLAKSHFQNEYIVEKGRWTPYGTLTGYKHLKSFKTKSQAIANAKSYMRSH